ncbi:MAG: DEAD/DEAH box helicase [Candidatus Marinimicrobia bacterium]|nr:DEAD/DEAH box helicase [Candidatus Neomarinimicrobiota bacterium]MBT4000278.1 DEAD/DEAH box helicase [Candidatus Neomarinimicrobiota bacterium]MBT4578485.1 DEAD/DEAH box helicase [Candidatus Neomarinimicrobiota bacterium]MBT5364113.1 DEAD/DEAH box helicase [Candidatus Neomarinimicrobiota bacterium]MBT5460294.1 DEAD/DEAH box helicase [Candidatus Neomarinimicrobiota bacterium]
MFDNKPDAYQFYLTCLGLNRDAFLYYPDVDDSDGVPGFNAESDRYRAEAIIKLGDINNRYICIGTNSSLTKKDIDLGLQKNTSSLVCFPGKTDEKNNIITLLCSWGYEKTDTVYEPRKIASRGEVLDVFPPYFGNPVRILFDYDKIERISLFDPTTQLTTKSISRLTLKGSTKTAETLVFNNVIEHFSNTVIASVSINSHCVNFAFKEARKTKSLDIVPILFKGVTIENKKKEIDVLLNEKTHIDVIGGFETRSLLSKHYKNSNWVEGSIRHGFYSLSKNLVVISASDFINKNVLVEKWKPVKTKSLPSASIGDISSLTNGDPVVHTVFGIGIFRGLIVQETPTGEREAVKIEYKNNSCVFVSLEKMDLIHRFVGSNTAPKISTLGTKNWETSIKNTTKSVQVYAAELLKLYANKNKKRDFNYNKSNDLDGELEASFPFIETPDQRLAIENIFSDMNGNKPIDRLICGDVGFGKTEVAIRAIMKAVLSKKQVVFLCPTTILADQHYITCRERLGKLGVKVGLLSRFKTKKDQSFTINLLKTHNVDVLIGTHRVLSQDVVIPELGLLIVDEEHRFGVAHKEKIRTLMGGVDVISLSATPIPRTLQQSLVGIRDISLIQTPPRSRLPIETSVRYYDWGTVYTHIERELARGGQTYFLHNDIASIPFYTKKLKDRFPNKSIENIHGQMGNSELESKILSFFDGGIDVLVCTTIIESGLDVSNANCIVINNAQNFGLSQLYQIRGRVGRGDRQANCLLLIPRKPLEKDAHRRLKTIEQYTSLGSGYDISLKDLEIRGAGSLFGYKQSGHISSIGFELYCSLLKDEVDSVMGRDKKDRFPNVVYSEAALIEDVYISNPTQRLGFYSRLSQATHKEDVIKTKNELKDRFGKIPQETTRLLFIAEARVLFKNTSVINLSIDKTSVGFVLDDIFPYKTLDALFGAVSDFKSKESIGVHYGKTKSDNLTVTFSTLSIEASMGLLFKCYHLFFVNKKK